MTLDEAVALSLMPDLSRVGLADRLRADDPVLLEESRALRDRAQVVRMRAETVGIHVLPWNDPRFPTTLLAIPDMPPVLWYRGALDALRAPAVAVVGSRAASAVALETGARLGTDLAALGVTVVSGLARGVDSSAHRGALCSGRTIAVLGSGVDRVYPHEHAALCRRDRARGSGDERVPTGYAAARVSLSDAQSAHQRAVESRCCDRGERTVRLADYRRVRPRTGPGGDGGAGQRAERA